MHNTCLSTQLVLSSDILWEGELTTEAKDSGVNTPCGLSYLTLHSSLQWENALGSCLSLQLHNWLTG